MKKFMKRITASLLVICMLTMGSVAAFAETSDILSPDGVHGKISCAFVDSNGEYDGRTATGRITFSDCSNTYVHYTLKMYYFDEVGNGDMILANKADFTYYNNTKLSLELEANVPAGYTSTCQWFFEVTWDDGKDWGWHGMDSIGCGLYSPLVLHDDSFARVYLLIGPDGKIPWEL